MSAWINRLRSLFAAPAPNLARRPHLLARASIGLLLAANLVALWFVLRPLGGSPEELEQQLADLRQQSKLRKSSLDRIRALADKVEKARLEGDQFQAVYFTDSRVASSTIVTELTRAAKEVGIKPKEHAFAFEPIEGSQTLSILTITANYEGTYADLVHFVNRMDRSTRFLIMDSLAAAPQQGGTVLGVSLRLNAFVRDVSAAETKAAPAAKEKARP
jgi:type IV pilus assembly protein PilO